METPQISQDAGGRPGLPVRRPCLLPALPKGTSIASGFARCAVVPSDRIGVTPPEQIEGGQGLLLSIGCPKDTLIPKVEALCRSHGAEIHRQRR